MDFYSSPMINYHLNAIQDLMIKMLENNFEILENNARIIRQGAKLLSSTTKLENSLAACSNALTDTQSAVTVFTSATESDSSDEDKMFDETSQITNHKPGVVEFAQSDATGIFAVAAKDTTQCEVIASEEEYPRNYASHVFDIMPVIEIDLKVEDSEKSDSSNTTTQVLDEMFPTFSAVTTESSDDVIFVSQHDQFIDYIIKLHPLNASSPRDFFGSRALAAYERLWWVQHDFGFHICHWFDTGQTIHSVGGTKSTHHTQLVHEVHVLPETYQRAKLGELNPLASMESSRVSDKIVEPKYSNYKLWPDKSGAMLLKSTSANASGLDMKASIKASIHNLLLLSMLANQLALTSMLFSRSHNLLLERGIFDYVCALGLSNITFTQPQVSPTYFKLDFPFDPGVSRNCVQGIGPALEKDLVCASEFLGSTDLIRGDYGLLFVITIGEETLGFVIGLIITIGEETLGFVIGLIETPQLQIGSTFSTSINLVMFDNKEEHELFAIFLFWFCYPKDYAYHTALLGSPIKLLEISCYVTIVDFPFDPGEFDHPSISFDTSFQGIDTKFGRQFALNELFLVLFSCHLRQQVDLPQLIFHQLVGLYLIGRKSQLIGYGHYIARSRVRDPIFCRAVILKDCIQTGLEVVNGKPILFFDEIHLVLGAGWTSMSIEVSIYFKSLIAKRKIDAPEVFDEMLDSYNAFISPDISSIRRKTTTEFSLFKDTYLYEFLLETEIFQGMFFTVRANNVETVRSLSGNVAFLLTSDYSDGKVYNERKSSCFEFKYAGGSSFVSASSVVEHVISTELTCVVGSVLFFWNQIPFAYASIIWNKELNKQLRTTLHSHPDILVEVEKHGFPFAKSLTVSRLLQEWVYSNGDSASLVAFLLALCNEAASFRQESTLFSTQRLFALKSLQLVLLAYCSVVIDGVMGATRSQKQTKKKLYAGHFVHLLTFEWLPPWSLDVFLARFEVSMTTADPLKPSLMGFLILNLEDKVLIEDGGNVMNENSPIDDTGRELVTFMWDPG